MFGGSGSLHMLGRDWEYTLSTLLNVIKLEWNNLQKWFEACQNKILKVVLILITQEAHNKPNVSNFSKTLSSLNFRAPAKTSSLNFRAPAKTKMANSQWFDEK